MDKFEKIIYSVKYLPQILYFGSAVVIFYDAYCDIFKEAPFLPDYLQLPLIFFFFYMTHLAIKNYKKD